MSVAPSHTTPSAIADRTAQVSWQGTLAAGHGTIRSGSGVLSGQEVTCPVSRLFAGAQITVDARLAET